MLAKILDLDTQLFIYLNGLGCETYDGLWLFITKQFNWIPFFVVLLGAIFRSICEAVEMVLLKDKGSVPRTIDMDDASLILEDMDYLKEWFVQDGAGIDENDAVEWGRRIQQLVRTFFVCFAIPAPIFGCNSCVFTLSSLGTGSPHGQSFQRFDRHSRFR